MGSGNLALDMQQKNKIKQIFKENLVLNTFIVNLPKVIGKPNCKAAKVLVDSPSTLCAGSGEVMKSSCRVSII
jgi:hypothetical protein